MRGARFIDRAIEAVLGISTASIVFSLGLQWEAEHPSLPGASPVAGFHTVVSSLGFASPANNRIPLGHLGAIASARPDLELSGSLGRSREVSPDGLAVESVPLDWVVGPLFEGLRVPLVGRSFSPAATRLPLSQAPVREAIVSQARAAAWFGSAEKALGRRLRVSSMQAMVSDELAWIDFQIVGVAAQQFRGTDIERPVDLWLGINGWSNVLFPEQQRVDVEKRFGASTLAVVSDRPERTARELTVLLESLGEPDARIELVPNAGYHPERRARFRAIGQALGVNAYVLEALLATCLFSFLVLNLTREAESDRVRGWLGEPANRRWRRYAGRGLLSSAMIAAFTTLALWTLPRLASDALPLARGIERALGFPALQFALATIVLAPLLLAPLAAVSRWRLAATRLASRSGQVATVLTVLVVCVAVSWMTGTGGLERLHRLARPGLSPVTSSTYVTPVVASDRRWIFDPSRVSTGMLESRGIALASVGPVGTVLLDERGTLQTPSGDISTIAPLNFVSPNYFEVVGAALQSRCGPWRQWDERWVAVNRSFLQRHGLTELAQASALAVDGGTLRVCGVVEDAHVTDARAGLAPMVYQPLRQRRQFSQFVTRGPPAESQRATMKQFLADQWPEAQPGASCSTSDQLTRQLAQEREIATIGGGTMMLGAAIGTLTALLLGAAVLQTNLRSVATRRALGCGRLGLLTAGLFAARPRLCMAIAMLVWCSTIRH